MKISKRIGYALITATLVFSGVASAAMCGTVNGETRCFECNADMTKCKEVEPQLQP